MNKIDIKKNELIKKETNYLNLINPLQEEIKEVLKDIEIKGRSEKDEILEIVLIYLSSNGKILKSDVKFYYFYNLDNTLYDFKSSKFRYMISNLTCINLSDTLFTYLISGIESHIYSEGEDADIKEFSNYDEKNDILYIYTNGSKIIKITESDISEINNGDESIIFTGKESYKEWNFIKDVDRSKDYLGDLIKSVNFIEGTLTKEEQNFIIKHYIYSLFFPELFLNRPILTFIGEKGSGKSFFFEMILKICFGLNIALSNLPSKEDDLKVNLLNEYLCFFDNVDDKISLGKIDILCSTSTGGHIRVRKLYSDGEQIEKKINCFLGFTSRNPSFKRDDLSDRMIIFKLGRRNKFKSSKISQKVYLDNRDIILSNLCYELQNILKNIKEYKDYDTNFRISDFSTFVMNNNKDNIEKVNKIFDGLEFSQQELTTSTDSLLLLLESIIEDSKENTVYGFKEGEFYKSNELHKIFAEYAKNKSHIVSYGFKSPQSLGKSLNNNIKAYKNIYNININLHRYGGNVVKYSFSRGITNEETKEVFDYDN